MSNIHAASVNSARFVNVFMATRVDDAPSFEHIDDPSLTAHTFSMTTTGKVTNESVGDALGIDQSYVSLIRRGVRVPSRSVVVALVEAYPDHDPAELLAAYTARDPAEFAAGFCRIVALPLVEVTENA